MNPAVLGFAAWSGTGKTTLLRKLIPALRAKGLGIGVIKHAHHTFDVDQPGKDSYELRHAGAQQVLIGSRVRWALMVEYEPRNQSHSGTDAEPTLAELLEHMPSVELDLILVEGFKYEQFAKIELHRLGLERALLYPNDSSIIAIACDGPLNPTPPVPVLELNDLNTLTEFVLAYVASHCAPDSCLAAAPAAKHEELAQ
jgi:molybdopterin-guanine dinucleotide biosynthesis protein B